MNTITDIQLLRPMWLVALLPLALLLWVFYKREFVSRSWQSICSVQLLPFILTNENGKRSLWPLIIMALVGMLTVLSLAGPVWKKLPQPVFRAQSALIFVVDLSLSMDAKDIAPSRLSRARHKILDILEQRKEGQTGLIVYAHDSFVVSPLTQDAKTIASLVPALSTDLMPEQGSNVDSALEKAEKLFQQAGINKGQVLLLSDGVNLSSSRVATKSLSNKGHSLSILAIGSVEGSPIVDKKGRFVKDARGEIVISKLDEPSLRELSSLGNGRFQRLTASDHDIKVLVPQIDTADINRARIDSNTKQDNKLNVQTDVYREEGPWLLLLVLPFAAIVFRRGWVCVLIIAVLPMPKPAYAFDWNELWLNKNQLASKALDRGENETAANKFTDPEWKAAAQYRSGNYEQTLQALESVATPSANYNQGNALAKLGRYQQAVSAYNKVLEADPKHEDALYNKKLVEELLKQQENQEQKQDKNSKNQDSQNQDGESKNSQSQDQQSKDSQSQDSQSPKKAQNDQSKDSKKQDSQSKNNDQQQAQQGEQKDKQNNDSESKQSRENDQQQAAKQQDSAEKSEEEKAKHELQQSLKEQKDKNKNDTDEKNGMAKMQNSKQAIDEQQEKNRELSQANEQWLRRIPDDPGGLLRRKFEYQSIQNRNPRETSQLKW